MNNTHSSSVTSAIVLALGIIIAASIGAYTFYVVRSFDYDLTTTGSARQAVTSDVVKWQFNISRNVYRSGMQQGYIQLAGDLDKVKTFLTEKGVADDAITIQPVSTNQFYSSKEQAETEYTLRQNVIVESQDVQGITQAAKDIIELAQEGVFVDSNYLSYYYSELADLRVSLLGDALTDAKARAEQIVGSSGGKVGPLKSAASGVVQVLAPNSIDISDYGQYDTSTIDKEVMVTVRATFAIK